GLPGVRARSRAAVARRAPRARPGRRPRVRPRLRADRGGHARRVAAHPHSRPARGEQRRDRRPLRRLTARSAHDFAMFLDILVAVDRSESSRRALEHAIDLARAMNAILTLIALAPPLSSYVTLAGVNSETMLAELDRWAAETLAQAASAVPDDVVVHRVQRRGSAGAEIVDEIERGKHDLVVLGSRGRGRAQ